MNRLKDLREDRDLKQKDICQLINVDQSTLSKYEVEKREIPLEHLKKLTKFYNTSIDYVYFITNESKPYKESQYESSGRKNRLKELRNKKNLSQKEISLKLNLPKSTYIKYENTSLAMSPKILIMFATFFNTSIDYIIYYTDEQKPHEKSIIDC